MRKKRRVRVCARGGCRVSEVPSAESSLAIRCATPPVSICFKLMPGRWNVATNRHRGISPSVCRQICKKARDRLNRKSRTVRILPAELGPAAGRCRGEPWEGDG